VGTTNRISLPTGALSINASMLWGSYNVAQGLLRALTAKSTQIMNNDNNSGDEEKPSNDSSILQQDERTDRTLLRDFGLAAIASLTAFFSAVLTTVVEGHSVWRPFWLTLCIISVLCAVGLIFQAARNFGRRP
jgi:hypothetical protein